MYETIGCYNDTSNRAIQPLEGKDSILDGSYSSRKNPIAKCAVAAMRAGYSMFAVQDGGWCAASATAAKTFESMESLQLVRMTVKVDHGLITFTSSKVPVDIVSNILC